MQVKNNGWRETAKKYEDFWGGQVKQVPLLFLFLSLKMILKDLQ